MRSKEVDDNINALKQDIYDLKGFLTDTEKEKWQQAIETLLDYISELEKDNINWKGKYHLLSRKIDVTPNLVIRDKIHELKNVDYRKIWKLRYRITSQIDVLNELLEGE